jgi:hypothetical protein
MNVHNVSYITAEDVFDDVEPAAEFYFSEHPFPSNGEMILVEYSFFLAHLDGCLTKADKATAMQFAQIKERLTSEFGTDAELLVSVGGWC